MATGDGGGEPIPRSPLSPDTVKNFGKTYKRMWTHATGRRLPTNFRKLAFHAQLTRSAVWLSNMDAKKVDSVHRTAYDTPYRTPPADRMCRRCHLSYNGGALKPPHSHRILTTAPHPARGRLLGGELLRELPPPAGVLAFRVLRCIEVWSVDEPDRAVDTPDVLFKDSLHAFAEEVAQRPGLPDALRYAFISIVCELAAEDPHVPLIELSCIVVSDWALATGAKKSALAFAEAAGFIAKNPRMIFLAGKLHREFGVGRDADLLLRRASVLATRAREWETKIRSEAALGVSFLKSGNYKKAQIKFTMALRTANRRRVKQLIGELWHYLFVVAVVTRRYPDADVAAREAVIAYGPDHDRLPHYAHDLAVYALDRDDNASAARVLLALLGARHWRDDPPNLLLAHGTTLRALGATGRSEQFASIRSEFLRLLGRVPEGPTHAQALLAAGRGALNLDRLADAREWLSASKASAERTQQHDLVDEADRRLEEARAPARVPPIDHARKRYDELARMTIRALGGRAA